MCSYYTLSATAWNVACDSAPFESFRLFQNGGPLTSFAYERKARSRRKPNQAEVQGIVYSEFVLQGRIAMFWGVSSRGYPRKMIGTSVRQISAASWQCDILQFNLYAWIFGTELRDCYAHSSIHLKWPQYSWYIQNNNCKLCNFSLKVRLYASTYMCGQSDVRTSYL